MPVNRAPNRPFAMPIQPAVSRTLSIVALGWLCRIEAYGSECPEFLLSNFPGASKAEMERGMRELMAAGFISAGALPPSKKRAGPVSLKVWVAAMRAKGEKLIPENDPVFTYAGEAGIPDDFMQLAWKEFKTRYTEPDAKRYMDWRAVFRNAIRGNWLKLWYFPEKGGCNLSTAGEQARRYHESIERANKQASPGAEAA